jgi:hypothetical protein
MLSADTVALLAAWCAAAPQAFFRQYPAISVKKVRDINFLS